VREPDPSALLLSISRSLIRFSSEEEIEMHRARVLLTITPLERAALRLLADGRSIRQIAGRLDLAERELETQVNSLFIRMGVASPAEAIAAALRRGLLTPAEYGAAAAQEAELAKPA
jgi:DNA-binding NarL/FixJ family response regulator